jgi:hypothetical protein
MAKRKSTTNDLKNITHKTKDPVARTTLKMGGVNAGDPEGLTVPAPLVAPIMLL